MGNCHLFYDTSGPRSGRRWTQSDCAVFTIGRHALLKPTLIIEEQYAMQFLSCAGTKQKMFSIFEYSYLDKRQYLIEHVPTSLQHQRVRSNERLFVCEHLALKVAISNCISAIRQNLSIVAFTNHHSAG